MNAQSDRAVSRTARLAIVSLAMAALPLIAQAEKKEFKYSVAPGSSVMLVNQRGTITVKPAPGRQLVVTTNTATDKTEIDAAQNGSRVTIRTHVVNKPTGDEAKVDYDVQLPADTSITIDAGSGDVKVENVRGNVSVDSEEGQVDIRGINGGIVQVQSVNAAVVLNNLQKTRVQVTSMGGAIQLSGVSGSNVTAKSTTGNITYAGDFAGGGNYLLTNHSGEINVSLPANASVDLTARSIQGSVENDLPLQKPAHTGLALKEGKSLTGTLNAGASSVELRSFSGKIRVKKQ
jgi:DUF4097 and DUF4098 domain-containing protein YvlB